VLHPLVEPLDALVLDLDGVVYRGGVAIDGAPEAILALRAAGKKILFLTNNSTRSEADVQQKLSQLGIEASPDEIIASARVTADALALRGLAGKSVFVIGGPGIKDALAQAGFDLWEGEAGTAADVVVVGNDRSFNFDSLRIASRAVDRGALFVATNDDPSFPTADGTTPGAGAIVAAVEVASGRTAEVMGKPNRPMMEAAAARLGDVGKIAIVGDQPKTDLDGGRLMGWTTILVLSGVTDAETARTLRPPPDLIVPGLAGLIGADQRALFRD
jgi:phosphoglycolate/pyridoxal phosphate phosphatase family enzyme